MFCAFLGLVKELDTHRFDYATKHLSSHATYVLVEKQLLANVEEDHHDGDSPIPPNIAYVPLLDNYSEIFPDFRVHVVKVEKKKKRNMSKSPSPAGVRGLKGAKALAKASKLTVKKNK